MPPPQPLPTPLSIATNALSRLLREEASYGTELAAQKLRVGRLRGEGEGMGVGVGMGGDKGEGGGMGEGEGEEGEGNWEWRVRQEEQAVRETEAVFGPLRERIGNAVERLEGLLASGGDAGGKEIDAANEVLVRARARAAT